MANKKYVNESLSSGKILGRNQTLQNYLKVSVGNDFSNLTKCDRIQSTDTKFTKYPITSGGFLRNWFEKKVMIKLLLVKYKNYKVNRKKQSNRLFWSRVSTS